MATKKPNVLNIVGWTMIATIVAGVAATLIAINRVISSQYR